MSSNSFQQDDYFKIDPEFHLVGNMQPYIHFRGVQMWWKAIENIRRPLLGGAMDLLEQVQLGVQVVYDRPLAEAEGRRDIADARLGIPVSRHHFGEHPQDVVPRVIALPRRHQFRRKAARNAFRPRLPAMAVAAGIAWWWTVSAGMSTSRGLSHAASASAAGRLEPLIAALCSRAEPNSALRRLA
jgi:hypothetical protein